ncbi:hypothetical protein GJ744_001372 [Endocarpon pusillum]|uniref:Uncharacterized protein n=1 Tax=Endocarpon pusillum TaxID=364733 RepID=A0A8H7AT18_9EURO|nr:hypothetical protein GJ744_001372 [Endocarpon pusillum]
MRFEKQQERKYTAWFQISRLRSDSATNLLESPSPTPRSFPSAAHESIRGLFIDYKRWSGWSRDSQPLGHKIQRTPIANHDIVDHSDLGGWG